MAVLVHWDSHKVLDPFYLDIHLYCSGNEANLVKCYKNYNNTHVYSGCQHHYYDGAVIICECKYHKLK